MSKLLKIIVLGALVLVGGIVYSLTNKEPREQRLARLNQCISEKLPEIKIKYQNRGLTVGEPKIWMDWFDATEYAVFPLMKNGKQENKKSATITTGQKCSWMEIEYSAN